MQVRIVPVGEIDTTVLGEAAGVLREQYDASVDVDTAVPYSALEVDPRATPYDAERILSLEAEYTTPELLVFLTRLPITHADRAFVFGIADEEQSACLVSTYRLFQSTDGNTLADPGTALFRVRKEVAHEVGHTLGQPHCGDSECVMNFSMDLSGIDNKSERLCGNCAAALTSGTGRR